VGGWWGPLARRRGHARAPGRAGRMDVGVGEEDEDTARSPKHGGSSAGAARAEQQSWSGRSAGIGDGEGRHCERRRSGGMAEGARQKRI